MLLVGTHGADGKVIPAALAAISGNAPIDVEKRRKIVNEVFPRLLYICSSVYCFMFGGNMKERQKWVNFILSYASQAAAGIVNQKVLPVLVVVFNTATLSDGIWDVEKATKEANLDANLKAYFRDVHVVCIFHGK
jgi:hypothetical protein